MHKCEMCRYKGEHQEMGFAATAVCTNAITLEYAIKAYNAPECPYNIDHPADKLNQAVEDFKLLGRMGLNVCPVCVHYNHGEGSKQCVSCPKMDNFIWRGVAKEENR